MRRRDLLAAVTAGLAAGVAGCQVTIDEDSTPTGTLAPSPSTLVVRVENEDDTTHDVRFRLQVSTPGADSIYLFDAQGVEPGATRTLDPRELDAGEYELRATFPLGSATVRWTGNECAEKLVVVRFTGRGTVISDRCPATE